jgi:DNA helicase-2/ATP-dependent DNA helicase PcrA
MQSILDDLNEAQQEAVRTTDGPVLILAGAGSGKTRALTFRIAYLLYEKQVAPHNILAVTFTNKAAQEMRERVSGLTQTTLTPTYQLSGGLNIGTFHSICARILREEIHILGYNENFTIYDTGDQEKLMRQIVTDLHISTRNFSPKAFLHHISAAKNELIGPEEYAEQASDYFTEIVAKAYPVYQKALKDNNALDFDDLIGICVELFEKHPEVLDRYQERWKYIHIDEYQDTNHAQYRWVKQLAQKYRNLCVVGDDWQGIYSWRGADIRNILNFEKDYPEAKVIKLEQNYRSTKNILEAAQGIIGKNRNRTDKKLWTDNETGDLIKLKQAFDEKHEGMLILDDIEKRSLNYSDTAILYRTNAQSRALEEAMLRAGIPYQIVGGVNFYQRREIKDVIAYLTVLLNPLDKIAILRIINTPSRKIGSTTLEKINHYANQNGLTFYEALVKHKDIDLPRNAQTALEGFARLVATLREVATQYNIVRLIEDVVIKSGYKEYLLDGTDEGMERFENVQELMSAAIKFSHLEPAHSLRSFLEEVALISDIDAYSAGNNYVTLMTLHAAKGLEFPHVFLAGMEENIFPHSRSLFDPLQEEEERRLCYVGMTRAKESLTLIAAKQRMLHGSIQVNPLSRFIGEISQSLLEFESTFSPFENQVVHSRGSAYVSFVDDEEGESDEPETKDHIFKTGDKVTHPSFGKGIIVTIEGDIATIAFQENGVKKMVLSVAPLKKL